jgi:tetratricopeptide (TPR) repeat protein
MLILAPRLIPGRPYGHLVPPPVAANSFLALTLAERGDLDSAVAEGESALQLAEKISQPWTTAIAIFGLAFAHAGRGAVDHARRFLDGGLDVAREWDFDYWLATLGWLAGRVETVRHDPASVQRLAGALQLFEARGFGPFRTLAMVNLGDAQLVAHDADAAFATGRAALARACELGERGHEAEALRLLGDIASYPDSPDIQSAERHYREALAVAAELGMRPLVAHCHLGLGKLYRRTGKREQAQEHLATATTMYREMGMISLGRHNLALAHTESFT